MNESTTNFVASSNDATAESGGAYKTEELLDIVFGVVVPVFFGLIFVIGIVGNSLVVYIISTKKHFHSSTNTLLANLAISDLSFLLFCVPFTATQYVLAQWPFSSFTCKFVQYMIHVTALSSCYTLVLMAIIRYIVVVHPLKSLIVCTVKNTVKSACIVWALSFSMNAPCLFIFVKFRYNFMSESRSSCMINPSFLLITSQLFNTIFFTLCFILPYSIICILYYFVLRALWSKGDDLLVKNSSSSQAIEEVRRNAPGSKQIATSTVMKNKQKVTKMTIIVIVAFFFCWLPIYLMIFFRLFSKRNFGFHFEYFYVFANCLAYMNSCINPILYTFFSKSFHKQFASIFCPTFLRAYLPCCRFQEEKKGMAKSGALFLHKQKSQKHKLIKPDDVRPPYFLPLQSSFSEVYTIKETNF